MKLLPCPFCGSEVELKHKYGNYGYIPDTVSIRCSQCSIGFVESAEAWEQGRGYLDIQPEAEEKVTNRWNTRY